VGTDRSRRTPFEQAVLDALFDLRRGDVVSYGGLAVDAGFPGRARGVGAVLAANPGAPNWWRVVAADGRIVSPNPYEQARRLRAEGVQVTDGRVVPRPRGAR
jgi:methylated-DNA-protein-cysteine methyltransferase-like protein